MTTKFYIDVKGTLYEYEPDYYELKDALEHVCTNEEINEEEFEDLVDGYYDELAEYFQETKADDFKAAIETDEYVDWYYRYGRNI